MFFPLGDDNPRRGAPVATGLLIAINVAVYVSVNLSRSDAELEAFFLRWGFDAAHPVSVQVLTSMFLHGGFAHILGNMWMLWIVGDNVEDRVGRPLFVALYLLGGFAATSVYTAIAQVAGGSADVLARFGREHPPLVGASGAVFAAMGMYLVFFPRATIRMLLVFVVFVRTVRVPAIVFIGLSLLMDLFLTLAARGPASGGVATAAHVGGGLFGIAAALFVRSRGPAADDARPDVFAAPPRRGAAARFVEDGAGTFDDDGRDGAFGGGFGGAPRGASPMTSSSLAAAVTELVRAGDVRRAIDVYPAWVASRPSLPLPDDVQIEIAHEYYRQGLPRDAIAAYQRYLDDEPEGADAPEAAFRLGILHSQGLGDPSSAVAWLRRAVQTHRDPRTVEYAMRELRRIG